MLIIDDSTKCEYLDTLQIQHISEKIPSLLSETLIDCKEMNITKNKLNRIPNIKSQVFNSEIENYPENSVNVWFSKIRYDHSKTHAIITLGMIFGPEAGGGILTFSRNNEGEWNVEYIYGLWIA